MTRVFDSRPWLAPLVFVLLFVLLFRGFDWPSWLALFVALVAASGQTFVLSRFWAFQKS